ncbi:hypothetical protein GW17_00031906 [Ensete ventricosum]|nr:hypothetical protein GW17_00031906 [Ensete ventricosum]
MGGRKYSARRNMQPSQWTRSSHDESKGPKHGLPSSMGASTEEPSASPYYGSYRDPRLTQCLLRSTRGYVVNTLEGTHWLSRSFASDTIGRPCKHTPNPTSRGT